MVIVLCLVIIFFLGCSIGDGNLIFYGGFPLLMGIIAGIMAVRGDKEDKYGKR